MVNFVLNMLISVWVFAGWSLVGLGPALSLLPNYRKREALLLAPLLGLCLLTLVGLFQITVLLCPLTPHYNLEALALLSLVLCFWSLRKKIQSEPLTLDLNLAPLWLAPFALLMIFAWLYHRDGFQLLVGSSDQLQYCLDARQILEEMHRGTLADMPVPRYDHIVYDLATRIISYAKSYRRGAEVMLATTKAISGLSYEKAFPVLILCALMTLTASLGFLGRVFLYFSRFSCLILQLAFMSSFYLLLLHVQGSLAMLVGMTPGLLALAFFASAILKPSWRAILLAALVLAAYFSIYSEPVLINIVLPTALLALWQLSRSWSKGWAACKSLVIVYVLVFAVAPFAISTVVANAVINVQTLLAYLLPNLLHLSSAAAQSSTHGLFLPQWSLAAVVLGAVSYYDPSSINATMSSFSATMPWVNLFGFLLICSSAFLGYLRSKDPIIRLFALPLLCWVLVSLLMAYQQDGLRFARSLHYVMPFALLGLVILVTHCWSVVGSNEKNLFWVAAARIGALVFATFILMNGYTMVRTISYLSSHDLKSDTIILRFDPSHPEWLRLQQQLSSKHPFLLSGFQETIRPLAIASLVPSQTHVLGKTILSFWPLYDLPSTWESTYPWSSFNTRVSAKALQQAREQENHYHDQHQELKLVESAEQAVVPVGHGYPLEWLTEKDVYAPLTHHFDNICDVVSRKEHAMELQAGMVSLLKTDSLGPYRLLYSTGPILIHDKPEKAELLVLNYEGEVDDVKLRIRNVDYAGTVQKQDGKVRIAVKVNPLDLADLSLAVKNTVKLRSMGWE